MSIDFVNGRLFRHSFCLFFFFFFSNVVHIEGFQPGPGFMKGLYL